MVKHKNLEAAKGATFQQASIHIPARTRNSVETHDAIYLKSGAFQFRS
jgi:hypothetical protein